MKVEPIDPRMVRTDDARLRALQEGTVEALMESMSKVGLLEPILTFRPEGGGFVALVSGLHRLEAARRLKWESIPAVVYDNPSEIDRELIEIDENLIRAELSAAERAMHEAKRRELYEAAHPETTQREINRALRKRALNRQRGVGDEPDQIPVGYVAKAAQERGVDSDAIRKRLKRVKELGTDLVEKVKGTSLDSVRELDALIKLPPSERLALAQRAAAGEKVSARPPKAKEHTCEFVCKHCGKPA